jgi:hypothetical protein
MSTTDTTAAATPPAGWYPDPTGRHERRWWDGEGWTHEVADPAAPGEEGEVLDAVGPAGADPLASTEPAADEAETETDPPGDVEPEPERFDAEPTRLPPEQRASTGAGLTAGPSRRNLILAVVGVVVVLAALFWGYENYSTADEWRDRGEELQARLDDLSSNADAVEDALSNSASRRARMEDSFQTVGELRDATEATITQLNSCVAVLNGVLNSIATGGDPTTGIDQANQTCGQAGMNGTMLIQILEELEAG